MMRFVLMVAFLISCSLSAYAQLKRFPVEKYKLENGMTVLLHQDGSLPIYSLNLWYDVGSSDEDPKRTGLAHFFEHLMFKGTQKNKEGVYNATIENNGGRINAFTNNDYTGYYAEMPAGTLETVLRLEADRMVNLEITEEKIKREREVVKEERRLRVENSPFGLALESLFLNAYNESSYRWSVVGSMKHLEDASLQDFKDFYKQFYAPNNATLILVGDFKKSKAKKWIKKYFASIKPSQIYRKKESTKVFAKGGKNIKIKKPVQSSIQAFSFPGVSIHDSKAPALDLLGLVLAEGAASRMYQNLIDKKKLVLNTDYWNFTPSGQGFLMFFNTLRPGVSKAKSKAAFVEVLKKLVKEGVTEEELKAAKKQIKLSSLSSYKTLSGKARGLATNELMFGDYGRLFTEMNRYEEVSLDELNKAAKKYLNFSKMNTVEVTK